MVFLELAERCEQASCADRDLDADIYRIHFDEPVTWDRTKRGEVAAIVPRYTSSLDAAMTLVPEHSLFTARTLWDGDKLAGFASVSRYEAGEFAGHPRRYWMDEAQANAATPALALCSAALRARAAQ